MLLYANSQHVASWSAWCDCKPFKRGINCKTYSLRTHWACTTIDYNRFDLVQKHVFMFLTSPHIRNSSPGDGTIGPHHVHIQTVSIELWGNYFAFPLNLAVFVQHKVWTEDRQMYRGESASTTQLDCSEWGIQSDLLSTTSCLHFLFLVYSNPNYILKINVVHYFMIAKTLSSSFSTQGVKFGSVIQKVMLSHNLQYSSFDTGGRCWLGALRGPELAPF